MKTPEQLPAMAPIGVYEPGKDWSPGVPEHLVDELTGKNTCTRHKGKNPPPDMGYPVLWVKKEE